MGTKIDYMEQICMKPEDCGKKVEAFGVKMDVTCMNSTGEQIFWTIFTLMCFGAFLLAVKYLVKRRN